ncbi:MAG: hypothetical protein NZ749_11305 [bacterium]|nr:hypothetical protein [bacterium]
MAEVWSYLSSLYNREGYEMTQTVWRWVALFFLPVVMLYAGAAIRTGRKWNRLRREARVAMESGQYMEALRKFSEAAESASLSRALHRPEILNTTDEAVGDIFFQLGQYPAAVYFYSRFLYRHFGEEFARIPVPPPGLPVPLPVTALYAKFGAALLKCNCYEEAIIWLRRAASAEYAGDAEVWRMLGEAYERIGNSQMASECKQHATTISGQQ